MKFNVGNLIAHRLSLICMYAQLDSWLPTSIENKSFFSPLFQHFFISSIWKEWLGTAWAMVFVSSYCIQYKALTPNMSSEVKESNQCVKKISFFLYGISQIGQWAMGKHVYTIFQNDKAPLHPKIYPKCNTWSNKLFL